MSIFSLRRLSTVTVLLILSVSVHAQQARIWLMLNLKAQDSVFVTDPKERAHLATDGWKTNAEAGIWPSALPGTGAMQRFAKSSDQGIDRIFTVTPEDSTAATQAGYVNEGTLGRAFATQLAPTMIPVYRFTKDGKNLWMVDKTDEGWAEQSGWKLKGVAFWLWPKPSA